jgi:hypothetical protein
MARSINDTARRHSAVKKTVKQRGLPTITMEICIDEYLEQVLDALFHQKIGGKYVIRMDKDDNFDTYVSSISNDGVTWSYRFVD